MKNALLVFLSLLALPIAAQAQFTYITNNGAITITGYTGSGGDVTIPATINGLPVTSIGGYAFEFDYSLTNVTIPDSIISIGDGAFSDCYNLTSMTIGNSVTGIGYEAFAPCGSLTVVYFDGNAPGADPSAFSWINCDLYGCHPGDDPATIFYLSGTTGWSNTLAGVSTVMLNSPPQFEFGTTTDGWSYVSDEGEFTLITGYGGSDIVVMVPSTINGLPVTGIAPHAFDDNSSLTGVTIPNSVTSIGRHAFEECESLTNVAIPNSVTSIGYRVFRDCTSLTKVMIPDSVTSIGEEAFWQCGLSNVTIPDSVISIGDNAFGFCYYLSSVIIGDNVTTIGDGAFFYCGSLTNVTIPDSVTSIGDGAFSACDSLTSVYFGGNAPTADSTAFDFPTVYYLPGTLGWDDFSANTGLPTALWFLPQPLILNQGAGFGVQSYQFGFTISWATNVPVVVEACTNLSNPVWLPVATNTLTVGTSHFSDPLWVNYPQRFYRVTMP